MGSRSPDPLFDAIRALQGGKQLLDPQVVGRIRSLEWVEPEGFVTLLFTDIVGSTGLFEKLGDERARALLRRHDDVVRGELKRYRGREVKHQGDSFMVAFASTRDALDCALDIQGSIERVPSGGNRLRIRAGLHSGPVIRERRDYYGRTVNLASRVASVAEGSQILVSDTTKAIAPVAFTFVDRGYYSLKAIPEEVRLYELTGLAKVD